MGVIYSFAHMGIHNENPEKCDEAVEKFKRAFNFASFDLGQSVIVAGPLELTKGPIRGTLGHIGIECSDVDEAIEDLQEKGFYVDESTLQYTSDGHIQSVYLQDTFGGFACHLLRSHE